MRLSGGEATGTHVKTCQPLNVFSPGAQGEFTWAGHHNGLGAIRCLSDLSRSNRSERRYSEKTMEKKKEFDYKDFHFRHVSKMIVQLDHESDRAVALVISAWLDDALSEMIKRKLVSDEKVIDEIFQFNSALGTFSRLAGLSASSPSTYSHAPWRVAA
jgi:hypothetical protein